MTCTLAEFFTAANIFLQRPWDFFAFFKTKYLLLIKQQSEVIVVRFRIF